MRFEIKNYIKLFQTYLCILMLILQIDHQPSCSKCKTKNYYQQWRRRYFLLRTAFARLVLAVDFKVDNNNKKGGNE